MIKNQLWIAVLENALLRACSEKDEEQYEYGECVYCSVVIRQRWLGDNGMRLSLCGNPKGGGSLDNTEYDGNDVD